MFGRRTILSRTATTLTVLVAALSGCPDDSTLGTDTAEQLDSFIDGTPSDGVVGQDVQADAGDVGTDLATVPDLGGPEVNSDTPTPDTVADTGADAVGTDVPTPNDTSSDATDVPMAGDAQADVSDALVVQDVAVDTTPDTAADIVSVQDAAVDTTTVQDAAVDTTTVQDAAVDTTTVQDVAVDTTTVQDVAVDTTTVQDVVGVDIVAVQDVAADTTTAQDVAADATTGQDVGVDTTADAGPDTSGCVAKTCADFPNAECGMADDGCGGTIDIMATCGGSGCTTPDTCGGAGSAQGVAHELLCGDPCPNRIECGFTNSSYYECGVVSDGCGGVLDMVADCGAVGCQPSETCSTHSWGYLHCTPGQCTKKTCADFPNAVCGLVNDGCGGVLDLEASCGKPGCTSPEVCGGGGAAATECGLTSCAYPPQTCADYASLVSAAIAAGEPLCGTVPDLCGGTVDLVADCGAPGCGSCTPGTPLAAQCIASITDPLDSKLCLENASGCPGQVVDVAVHVLTPDGCGQTNQRGINSMEGHGMELINPSEDACGVQNCIRREPWAGTIGWIQFPGNAIGCSDAQCPAELPVGHVDTILLRIPTTKPTGDYTLTATGGHLAEPCAPCNWCEANTPSHMSPTVRVY